MTYSYNQPSSGAFADPKDEVRFLIRDTSQTDYSVTDEEIDYCLEDSGEKVYLAASKAASAIAANYSKAATTASKSVGDLSISLKYEQAAKEYRDLAKELRMGKKDTLTAVYYVSTDSQFTLGQFDELRP